MSPGLTGRPPGSGPNGDSVPAASGTRYGRLPNGNDRSNECASYTGSNVRRDRNARYRPSPVKTGSLSANRPSVTSTVNRSATRASRIRLSGRGPGCAQASHAESGDQASSSMSPSSLAASSVTAPVSTLTSSSLPSCDPTATVCPSGDGAMLLTLPSRPAARVAVAAARALGSASIVVTASASAPSAPSAPSVTQTTLPVLPVLPSRRGRLARPLDCADSARAGPSVCVSQCTVPRTSTTLALPVSSQSRSPR